MSTEKYSRYAFISYNHKDKKYAKWLMRKLEYYRLPSNVHNEFINSRYLRPIFRDEDDLSSGVLLDELHKNLDSSKFLILICSPNSARSEYVNAEVGYFIENGRANQIIPLIIEGVPYSGSEYECFPTSLVNYAVENRVELLGINMNEGNNGKEKAFVRVVSRMLDLSFDTLWKRYQKERRRRILSTSLSVVVLITLFYYFAVPVSLSVKLNDDKHNLPYRGKATLIIGDSKFYISNIDTVINISSLPGYYKGRTIILKFRSPLYTDRSASVNIRYGLSSHYELNVKRDSTYGIFSGKIINNRRLPIENASISILNYTTLTDSGGFFYMYIPTDEQKETQRIRIEHPRYKTLIRDHEAPNRELGYVLE